MARAISTNHLFPDIHDEGKIKRYGLTIGIAVLSVLLTLFVVWAAYIGFENQFGPGGPSGPEQNQRP
ncbi:MAG TPA: hypothetical protein VGO50_07340 [Pyrinomonadaceae bacterium]|jgi:hypothetical protein|nr:hypothetical protein [Pyrinomonadaceae bacterium]